MKSILTVLLVMFTLGASAQDNDQIVDRYEPANMGNGESLARVTVADKYSYIQREGEGEPQELLRNMSVISGDNLETRSNAYSEIEFIDGSLVQVADRTRLEFQAVNEIYEQESLTVIRLHDGSLFLHTTDVPHNLNRRVIRVDTADGSAYMEAPGIYRIDREGSRMKLRVYRGMAELSGEQDSVPVYSGEYATISNMRSPSRVKPFNSFNSDRFERWAYDRRPGSSVSSKYVPENLASFSRDLDESGTWRYDNDMSTNIWIPTVEAGWAPYRRGYWNQCGPNLNWVSYDNFGYVTHHYGRWNWRINLGWYWCPDRFYSPAWVAWSNYDNYLGWCPLGYNNDPYYYPYRGHRGPRITVSWNYIPVSVVFGHRRDYNYTTVVVNGPRRISTRPVFVTPDHHASARGNSRIVVDPESNRRHANAYQRTPGTILTQGSRNNSGGPVVRVDNNNRSSNQSRVRIENSSTGTSAPSRHVVNVRRGNDESNPNRSSDTRGVKETNRNDRVITSGRGGTESRGNSDAGTEKGDRNPRSSGGESRETPTRQALPANRSDDTPSRNNTKPRVESDRSGREQAAPPEDSRGTSRTTPTPRVERDNDRKETAPTRRVEPAPRVEHGNDRKETAPTRRVEPAPRQESPRVAPAPRQETPRTSTPSPRVAPRATPNPPQSSPRTEAPPQRDSPRSSASTRSSSPRQEAPPRDSSPKHEDRRNPPGRNH